MDTQKDDRLERRISELTKWLIAHVRNDITVDGPRTVTPDRVWRLKDADGRIVHVLRVTELALDGERDLGKDLTQQQWLDRWANRDASGSDQTACSNPARFADQRSDDQRLPSDPRLVSKTRGAL